MLVTSRAANTYLRTVSLKHELGSTYSTYSTDVGAMYFSLIIIFLRIVSTIIVTRKEASYFSDVMF